MTDSSGKRHSEYASVRDTVESIWVAIVVAFVLRAFVVEAFVIPTGSMAPRLVGEHWDLLCPACGYEYAFGGPHDQPQTQSRFAQVREEQPSNTRCPNCGKPYNDGQRYLNSGDRVLVMKYLYYFQPPRPWDVVVFRNPQNDRENYIKRLIGLPGETIEIVHGDIFVGATPNGSRTIRRKPKEAQEAMWQVIFDNDYQVDRDFLKRGISPQWVQYSGQWETDWQGRRFTYKGGQEVGELAFTASTSAFYPHYGYNSVIEDNQRIDKNIDVCTDLKLSAVVEPSDANACVSMLLTSFEHRFKAELSAGGAARLLYQRAGDGADQWQVLANACIAPLRAGRFYEMSLANVDFSVIFSVDGRQVISLTNGYPETYDSLKARLEQVRPRAIPRLSQYGNAEESPVKARPIPKPEISILAWGAPCNIQHIRLMRDVYYTSMKLQMSTGPLEKYAMELGVQGEEPGWATTGNPITLRVAKPGESDDLDEFFVLGDNSPQSLDGRAWTAASPTLKLYDEAGRPIYKLGTVPRYNMIGKAFFVYWPSGFRLPGLPNLPIVPNVGKMRMIR